MSVEPAQDVGGEGTAAVRLERVSETRRWLRVAVGRPAATALCQRLPEHLAELSRLLGCGARAENMAGGGLSA